MNNLRKMNANENFTMMENKIANIGKGFFLMFDSKSKTPPLIKKVITEKDKVVLIFNKHEQRLKQFHVISKGIFAIQNVFTASSLENGKAEIQFFKTVELENWFAGIEKLDPRVLYSQHGFFEIKCIAE